MDVFEAMNTARAMRALKPDPIPEDLLRELVFHATRASNPGNSQLWEFIVLRDPAKKKRIGDTIEEEFRSNALKNGLDLEGHSGYYLASHLSEVPAIIFIGARNAYPPWRPDERFIGSACYPAGQNLIVAARALGLGATFTTLHALAGKVIHETLAIPEDISLALTIPVGYPARDFGPVRRKPIDEVIHWDGF